MKQRRELWRFVLVGATGFALDAGALYALMALGISPYFGKILSYIFAATGTWILHRKFTFEHGHAMPKFRQWLLFLSTNAIGGGVNYLVFASIVALVPAFDGRAAVAVAAGSIAGLVFNFAVSKRFVFKRPAETKNWSAPEQAAVVPVERTP